VKGLGKIEVGWVVGSVAVEEAGWGGGDRRGPVQDFAGRESMSRRLMKGWDLQSWTFGSAVVSLRDVSHRHWDKRLQESVARGCRYSWS